MSLADRFVAIAGITTRPDEGWMLQVGRNLTGSASGALRSKQYLIIDRDSKYTAQFRRLMRDSGTKVIRLPPRSPNLNAYAERFVRSIKDECLNRMIFVSDESWMLQVARNVTGSQAGSAAVQALPHRRSRHEILAAISAAGSGQRHEGDPAPADVAES